MPCALAGALRSIVDILQTLGGATLATTTVVLGASMFPHNRSQQTVDRQVTSGQFFWYYAVLILYTTLFIPLVCFFPHLYMTVVQLSVNIPCMHKA